MRFGNGFYLKLALDIKRLLKLCRFMVKKTGQAFAGRLVGFLFNHGFRATILDR